MLFDLLYEIFISITAAEIWLTLMREIYRYLLSYEGSDAVGT